MPTTGMVIFLCFASILLIVLENTHMAPGQLLMNCNSVILKVFMQRHISALRSFGEYQQNMQNTFAEV